MRSDQCSFCALNVSQFLRQIKIAITSQHPTFSVKNSAVNDEHFGCDSYDVYTRRKRSSVRELRVPQRERDSVWQNPSESLLHSQPFLCRGKRPCPSRLRELKFACRPPLPVSLDWKITNFCRTHSAVRGYRKLPKLTTAETTHVLCRLLPSSSILLHNLGIRTDVRATTVLFLSLLSRPASNSLAMLRWASIVRSLLCSCGRSRVTGRRPRQLLPLPLPLSFSFPLCRSCWMTSRMSMRSSLGSVDRARGLQMGLEPKLSWIKTVER